MSSDDRLQMLSDKDGVRAAIAAIEIRLDYDIATLAWVASYMSKEERTSAEAQDCGVTPLDAVIQLAHRMGYYLRLEEEQFDDAKAVVTDLRRRVATAEGIPLEQVPGNEYDDRDDDD